VALPLYFFRDRIIARVNHESCPKMLHLLIAITSLTSGIHVRAESQVSNSPDNFQRH